MEKTNVQAAYIMDVGGPEAIIFGDLPRPELEPGKVLVKVGAVAVNPIDTYIRSGAYKQNLPHPFIIGRDMVGEVIGVHETVSEFAAGDRVWCNNQGYSGRQGTFAEYLLIDSGHLYHLPEAADPLQVVASAHSALTCVTAFTKAAISSGETIFINGGSGNVGLCAIQLAKHLGVRVAVTAGSVRKHQWCEEAGADLVINYKCDSVSDSLRQFCADGVNVYWDLTQEPNVQQGIALLARRGRLLLSSGLSHSARFSVGDFYTRNCTMFGFTITELSTTELREHAVQLNRFYASHVFRPRIADIMQLSDARKAHEQMERGVDGKLVLTC